MAAQPDQIILSNRVKTPLVWGGISPGEGCGKLALADSLGVTVGLLNNVQ